MVIDNLTQENHIFIKNYKARATLVYQYYRDIQYKSVKSFLIKP